MSSFLEKSQQAFKSGASAAAAKVSNKRSFTQKSSSQPVAAPSPAPSNASNASKGDGNNQKRKREVPETPYSQPLETSRGLYIVTNVTYAVDWLKTKDVPQTFQDISGYLGKPPNGHEAKTLAGILRRHERVQFIPDGNSQEWDSGTFKHRPIIPVRKDEELLAYLQNRVDAQGLSVKDLKDGWEDCEAGISRLEAQHKVLVTRTKKDNHARMVWLDDPSLYHAVDPEFQGMWAKVNQELPNEDDLVRKLLEAGQKPASEDPSKRLKAAPKTKEKKKKAPRKGGRMTNTHMQHLLKDYSHTKR